VELAAVNEDLEKITAIAMGIASRLSIVEPKLYEKIYIDAVREYTKNDTYTDEDKILEYADKLNEQANNIVTAVDSKEYEKIKNYRDKIVALRSENEELMKVTYSDELTGALSRRWLLTKKLRVGRFLSNGFLVLIDMNGFKLVNDKYGHIVGDRVLKLFVESMQNQIIAKEYPCEIVRFGGDEFLILVDEKSDFGKVQIEKFLDTLKESLANKILVKAANERISIDFAYGIEEYKIDDMFPQVIEVADKAMYISKEAGRKNKNMLR
jgi:diguanylate cyclase (GGDEF)-like protein